MRRLFPTLAERMFIVPMLVMLEVAEDPSQMLFYGSWSMAFSIVGVALDAFVGVMGG